MHGGVNIHAEVAIDGRDRKRLEHELGLVVARGEAKGIFGG